MIEMGMPGDRAVIRVVGGFAAMARAKHSARVHYMYSDMRLHGTRSAPKAEDVEEARALLERCPGASAWDNALDRSRYMTPLQLARAVSHARLPGIFLLSVGWDRYDGGGGLYIDENEARVASDYVKGSDPEFEEWFDMWFDRTAYEAEGEIVSGAYHIEPSRRRDTLMAIAAAMPGSTVIAEFGPLRSAGKCLREIDCRTAVVVADGILTIDDRRSRLRRVVDRAVRSVADAVRAIRPQVDGTAPFKRLQGWESWS